MSYFLFTIIVGGEHSMAAFTKKDEKSPDIIYTQQFRIANTGFLGYTERDEAVDPENDFNVEAEKISDTDANIQHDSDETVAGYLGYTDRSAATILEDDAANKYPTFNQSTYNLNHEEHDQLARNIHEAAANKAMMWQGVVSFDSSFLDRQGIRNSANGHVDQRKIKNALQAQIPKFLHDENMDLPETFWWADIHLNKEHVHVHLAISQLKNTRPLKEDGSPKGTFSKKSFEHFKSGIHHSLENEVEQDHDLLLEKRANVLQKDMTKDIERNLTSNSQAQRLQLIYQELPRYKDKRQWRASNHSTDFKTASKLTDALVDDLLNGVLQKQYSELMKVFVRQNIQSRKKYGQHIRNTVTSKDKKLRDQIANRVYDALRELKPVDLEDDLLFQIKLGGIEGNNIIIDQQKKKLDSMQPSSREAKSLRHELGLRKRYVQVEGLSLEVEALKEKINTYDQMDSRKEVKDFFKTTLNERIELCELKKIPNWKLKKDPNRFSRKKSLNAKYVDAKNIDIKKVTPELIKTREKQIDEMIWILTNNPTDPIVQDLIPRNSTLGVDSLIRQYKVELGTLQVKLQIQENNYKYKNNLKMQSQVNKPLFSKLQNNYKKLNDVSMLEKDYVNSFFKKLNTKSKKHLHPARLTRSAATRALQSIRSAASKDVQAMHKIGRQDELDRLDQEELNEGLER